MDEKRDEATDLEDDEVSEEVVDEILEDDSSDDLDDGSLAEDVVTKKDTITGAEREDSINRANVQENFEEHDSHHSHNHHANINQNKPLSEEKVDSMGTKARLDNPNPKVVRIKKDTFWNYVKIAVVVLFIVLGYNYFFV